MVVRVDDCPVTRNASVFADCVPWALATDASRMTAGADTLFVVLVFWALSHAVLLIQHVRALVTFVRPGPVTRLLTLRITDSTSVVAHLVQSENYDKLIDYKNLLIIFQIRVSYPGLSPHPSRHSPLYFLFRQSRH